MSRALDRLTRRGAAGDVPPYEIHHGETGAKAHLVVASGELDLHAAPYMRRTLRSLLAQGRTHLVIDMSGATFVDSAMIGVLAGHLRQTRASAGSLALACSNENILRTLQIAGLDRELQILAAADDAAIGRVAAQSHAQAHPQPAPAPRSQTLQLPPNASELAFARGYAVAAARRVGLDPRQQFNLAVATNEAVANALQHGQPCSSGAIELRVEESRGSLTVAVRNGGAFVLEPPSPDPLREGGRGLRLMSRLVDEVCVQREDAQTVVQLSIHR